MLTIADYERFIEELPRASHEMEHITNFGRIVAKGVVLIASTIERGHQQLAEAIAGADPETARSRRAEERKRKLEQARKDLAALEAEAETDA